VRSCTRAGCDLQLTHSFVVPGSRTDTWEAFSDVASVAECFPGAAVTHADGDEFEGTCKVKLGPIALVYAGSGRFVERDESAGRFVIDAQGKDKRGNGTAGAKVTATLTPDGAGTRVEVVTDLQITGKPAQFGRGVIQDVSDKLLLQFVNCLESRLTAPPAADAEATTDTAATSYAPPPAPPPSDDALDLGAAVLPVLAKTYWRQAVAAVLVLLFLRRLLRRR
jgi:carbon monoxide dehydrogenase subunit G